MKHFIIFLFLLISIEAKANNFINYATLDYERVMKQSKAFIDLENNIENQRKKMFTSSQKKEVELTKKRNLLEKNCKNISKKECENSIRSNTIEFEKLNEKYRVQRLALNQHFVQASQKLENKLLEIIQEVAEKHGYLLVFYKHMLLYSKQENDITEEVVSLLNKKFPSTDTI